MVMMGATMRRVAFAAAGVAGAALLAVLVPLYDAPEPRGLTVTRGRVREVADAEARKWGIEVDKAFVVTTVGDSPLLDKELRDKPDLRRRADRDPVLGPRLFGFDVTYWRNGVDKYPPYGDVPVSRTGEVLAVRRQARNEEAGASPKAEDLRAKADAFVASRAFPGAPNPVFEDVRPTVLRSRTDYTFRYRVASAVPTGDVVCYLYVNFIGDKPAGYALIEEYRDGRRFPYDTGARRDVPALRRDLFAPLRPSRDVPEEISRGRGRRGNGGRAFRRGARALRHVDRSRRAVAGHRDGPRERRRADDDARGRRLQAPLLRHPALGPRLSRLVGRGEHRPRALGRTARVIRRRPAPRRPERHGRRLSPLGPPRGAGGRRGGAPRALSRLARARLGSPRSPGRTRRSTPWPAPCGGARRDARRAPFLVRRPSLPPRGLPPQAPSPRRSRPDGRFGAFMGILGPPVGPFARAAHCGLRRDRDRPPRLRVVGPSRRRDRGLRRRPPDRASAARPRRLRPGADGPAPRARSAAGRDRRGRGRRPRDAAHDRLRATRTSRPT